jgi:pimeloyl-ACP methyl ester carboxylesterase
MKREAWMVIRADSGPRDAVVVVFVHGAGVGGWMWKKQLESLMTYRAITIDLPDHGRARGEKFIGIESATDEIARFATDRLPGGKAHMVGHSLGAKIVLEMLSRRPDAVKSAVISSALERPMGLVKMMNSHALNAMSLWMLRSRTVARMQAAQFAFPDASMTESFLSDIGDLRVENLDRPISAFAGRLFLPPGLERAACPVLVTVGSREPKAMIASGADIAHAIPGARSAIIEGARHNYPWTHYPIYNAMLAAFLRGEELPSEG